MTSLRLRMTQNYTNITILFYKTKIFIIKLADILYLIGADHSTTGN